MYIFWKYEKTLNMEFACISRVLFLICLPCPQVSIIIRTCKHDKKEKEKQSKTNTKKNKNKEQKQKNIFFFNFTFFFSI